MSVPVDDDDVCDVYFCDDDDVCDVCFWDDFCDDDV